MQIIKSKHLCIYKLIIVIFLLACLGFVVDAEAKIDVGEQVIYNANHSIFLVSITGETQGLITQGNLSAESIGTLYNPAWEDFIIGLALSGDLMVPTDEAGNPIGKPAHSKLRIAKYFDKCSPLLRKALIDSEKLDVLINFFRLTQEGKTELYFTIELKEALVVEISSGADVNNVADFYMYKHTEGVTFVYKTITWNHQVSGTSFTDNW